MRCLYCDEERQNAVNNYFCSQECSDKYDIRNDFETSEDDEVVCPYCGKPQIDIADGGGYYDASGEAFECDWCHKEFYLVANPHTTFTATPTEEMIDAIYNGRAQEESEDY